MKIGIDARFYGTLGKGLGRYASELLAHLEKHDTTNDYVVFLRRENFAEYQPKNPRFTKVMAEVPWYGWKEQLVFPFILFKYKLDLMHFLHFNVPILYRQPFVVTVHDLILLSHPTPRASTLGPLLYRVKYFFYKLIIANAISAARSVITVSNCTKDEIIKRYPAAKDKIEVTYEACASALGTQGGGDSPHRFARGQSPSAPFALYVGNAYPHKNLERLVEAFSKFRKQGFENYKLVLVGASDYFYDRLKTETETKKLSDHIVFFGRATDAQLAELYRTASLYVFPSLCEGFGLPPLEAMCHGLPVASSNGTCLPEILGEAAHYFSPTDTDAMAAAMAKVAGNDELRRALIEKGRSWSARYSWDDCAKRTIAVYTK